MYSKNKDKAFTLVELIVVLTIVAILSTVGFVAYTDYLRGVRDSSRLQQITSLYNAFVLYSTKADIPLPNDGITILVGTGVIGYQGYINASIRDTIRYSDGGVDPKTKEDFTYLVSPDKKNLQVLGYFEEKQDNNLATRNTAYAAIKDYSSLYPRVVGSRLGVIIESNTQIPIQVYGKNFDILSATGSYSSLVGNSEMLTGSGVQLIGMIPGSNCKKILKTLGTAPSGQYKINPTGKGQFDVYCDMEADGGGWTFAGYIDNNASNTDVFFNANSGKYDSFRRSGDSTYSIDLAELYHTEMLVLYGTADISNAESTNNLLKFRYDLFTPGFYLGPLVLPNSSTFFGGGNGLYYSTTLSGTGTYTNRSRFGAAGWGIGTIGDVIPYLIRIGTGPFGIFKYPEVWGDTGPINSGYNAWIYVR